MEGVRVLSNIRNWGETHTDSAYSPINYIVKRKRKWTGVLLILLLLVVTVGVYGALDLWSSYTEPAGDSWFWSAERP